MATPAPIPRRLLRLVLLAGGGLALTSLLLVGIAHTLQKDEIDEWARRALLVSVRSRSLIVEQFLRSASEAAEQAAIRTSALPTLASYRNGEAGASQVEESLEPVLAEATRRSPGTVAIALLSGGNRLVSVGDPSVVEALVRADRHQQFVHANGISLFIVSHDIPGVGIERIAFDLRAVREAFERDLGLGQGFDRRLVATVGGVVVPVIPPGPLAPDREASSLLQLMADPRLLDGRQDPIVADEPLNGAMMLVPGTDLVTVVDVDHTSVIVERRRQNFASTLALGGIALVSSVALLIFMRRVSLAIETQAADLAESRRRVESQAADLERSNADLERFAYVASHDLEEPLRMVRGFLDVLQRRHGADLPSQAAGYVQEAKSGADRMQGMIRALLSFARHGAPRTEQAEPVELSAAIADALANLRDAVERTGADIGVAPDLPRVIGNREHLVQVVQNLVANAMKFVRDRKPRVRISATIDGDWATVAIADNGIGMSPEEQARLFTLFSRLHGPGDYPGFGIGLATCKRIVERGGGRIWVESEPGVGSTFFFTVRAGPR